MQALTTLVEREAPTTFAVAFGAYECFCKNRFGRDSQNHLVAALPSTLWMNPEYVDRSFGNRRVGIEEAILGPIRPNRN